MGLSASKRVKGILRDSPEFDTACDSVYEECLNLGQHAFSTLQPYQLLDASTRLHHKLSTAQPPPTPLINKWVSSQPPNRVQVDRALSVTLSSRETKEEEINSTVFKAFSLELFTDDVITNVRNTLLQRVPIGIVGIAGVGIATRSGKDLIGALMGMYSVGVAIAVYFTLSALEELLIMFL